jgi:branched chain amino acid efflux pump
MIAPVAAAAAAFSLSFGLLARAAGMGWAAPLVMSATTFAGSAQFRGGLGARGRRLGAGRHRRPVMLNARYTPIGISIASAFRGPVSRRLVQSQLIVDESWAMTLRRRDGFDLHVFLGAGMVLYVAWNAATVVGLLLGNIVGDPDRLGLDAGFLTPGRSTGATGEGEPANWHEFVTDLSGVDG